MTETASGITTSPLLDSAASATWDGPAPGITVVVSTHDRSALLSGMLDALERQDHDDFAVIVADNGSHDDTWSVLTARCAATRLRLRVLRLPFHDGPGIPRNTCITAAQSELIAFTDDDCLPTQSWLSAITPAFDDEVVIVQGRTVPEAGGWGGPWGRTLDVSAPSGLYETANLAARRTAIVEAGGFAGERMLSGRAFGEDVLLGAAIARSGKFRFVPDALVHHRVMPATYRDFLEERRRLAGFPFLLRQVPELRKRALWRVFLSRRTAITDLGLAGLLTAVLGAFFAPGAAVVGLFAVWVWFAVLYRDNLARFGRRRSGLGRLWLADIVGFCALVTGSFRARRLLL